MIHNTKSSTKVKKNAQSKDFNEIVNTHTKMDITKEEWDHKFHNYEYPEMCAGRRRILGCVVCDELLQNQNEENGKEQISE